MPLPQFVMDVPVLGLNVTDEHAFGTAGSVTVGGRFMTTDFDVVTVPHALLTASVMV